MQIAKNYEIAKKYELRRRKLGKIKWQLVDQGKFC